MCIRDRLLPQPRPGVGAAPIGFQETQRHAFFGQGEHRGACLLYTSDAADDLPCVDLGGRRIIKKKTSNIRKYGEQ